MGLYDAPSSCFITDSSTINISSSFDGIEYKIDYAGKNYFFQFHWNHENSKFIESNKHIIQGLILNNKFEYEPENTIYTNERLETIIKQADVPKTLKRKLDNLISYLSNLQEYQGSLIKIIFDEKFELVVKKLYFKNSNEILFFLDTLDDLGMINFTNNIGFGINFLEIKFSFKGLEYVIDIEESGDNSKNCFIAMSFSESMKDLRLALKAAIKSCGYIPLIVDEIHYESDVTINDAIIASIKKSKFLVADFTEQKHGVYFESGYALGMNKSVIYTCSKNDFSKTHFDTNHYPHIVYESLEELQKNLVT
tara:strand:+ start:34981 stop:35907 length:927 start_codon:yes stop_codon:yes gene_type:complete